MVRLARQARGWRQVDLAKAAGYSASTISRLETSRRASTDVEMLRRVAHAAGIPGDVLGALLGLSAPALATVAATIGRRAEENDPLRRRELLAAGGLAVPLRRQCGIAAIKLVGSPGGKLSGDPRAERSLRGFSNAWGRDRGT